MSRDGDCLMFIGRLFYNIGAVPAKDRLPIDIADMSVDGFTWVALRSTERTFHVGMQVRVRSGPCK